MERWAKLKTIRPGGEVKKVANVRALPENNAEFIQLLSIAKTAEDFAALNTIFNLAIDPPNGLELKANSMGGMSMAAVLTQIACRDEKFFLIKHKISNKFGRLEIIKKQDRYVSIVNFKLIAHLIGNITLKLPRGSKIAKMFTPDITFNIQARPHTVVLHDKYEYHLFYDSSWLFIANNIYEGEDLQIEVEIDLNTRLLDIDIELSYYAIEPHDSQAYSGLIALRERIKMDRVPVDNFTNLRVSVKSGQSAYFVHTYHLPFDDKPLYIDLNEQTKEKDDFKNKIEELSGKMATADDHPFLTTMHENQSTERKSNRSPIDDPLNNLPELIRIAGNNMNRVVHRNFDDGYRVDRISYISNEELNAIPEITPNESASRQGSSEVKQSADREVQTGVQQNGTAQFEEPNSMQPGIRQINVEADQIRRELGMQTQESDAEVGLEMVMHPEIENNEVLRVDGQYLLRVTNASNETIQYVDVKTGKAVATVLPVEVVAAIGNIHESVRSDTENTSDLLDELSDRDAVLDVEFNKIDNNKEEINHAASEPENEASEPEHESTREPNTTQPGIRQIYLDREQIRREMETQDNESNSGEVDNGDACYLIRVTNASDGTQGYLGLKTGVIGNIRT